MAKEYYYVITGTGWTTIYNAAIAANVALKGYDSNYHGEAVVNPGDWLANYNLILEWLDTDAGSAYEDYFGDDFDYLYWSTEAAWWFTA